MGEDAKGGVAEPASSEPLFVRSRFLFTEEDFKEYFVPAQIWLAEWSVRLSPIILVPLSLAALACVYFLVVDGASYDGMTRAVLVGIVLMAVAGVALATFEFRRHSRPDFDRMQGDIEVFFARLAKGHPAALYGYRGSLLEELRELRDVAAKMGMTKDDPSGGRQSRPLGVVLRRACTMIASCRVRMGKLWSRTMPRTLPGLLFQALLGGAQRFPGGRDH